MTVAGRARRTVFKVGAYPKQLVLESGRQVTIRPLQPADREELRQFFLAIPAADRFLLHHDVTDPKLVDRWTKHSDYFRALPLVAVSDGRIVADSVLLRGLGPARAHTALIRVLVTPRFRNAGLTLALLAELCRIADDAKQDPIYVEVVPGHDEELKRAARRLGFRKVASIPYGIRVAAGKSRDLILLARRS